MAQNIHFTRKGPGPGESGKIRRLGLFVIGALALLVLTLPEFAFTTEPAKPAVSPAVSRKILEELHYQVNVWIWQDAVKAKVRFEELAPGRYRAIVTGETQGFLAFVSGNWQGTLSTEMKYSQGKLLPLVYREASHRRGKRQLSEYRFDYAKGKVELWKLRKDNSMKKRWETKLEGPMYDPLTLFYNRRLTGTPLGKGGENVKYTGIPYPKPDEMVLRIGPLTPEGRKIMAEIENRIFENERSQIFAYLDNDGVPTKGWTRVLMFGNITMELLPGSKRVKREEVPAFRDQARVGK